MDKQQAPTVARIEALMERHKWNQAQAAAYLGIPPGTLGNWLQGTRKPPSMVARLLDVLGMVEALAAPLHATMLPKRGE